MASEALAIPRRRAGRRLGRHRLAAAGAIVLLLLALLALAAPWLAAALGLDPLTVDLFNRLAPPDALHPLGTDELGRDLLARLMLGGRVSLLVGVLGALGSTLIGTAIGLVAGYAGGRTDALLMRFTDGVIALPLLPLLIVLAAIDPGKVGLPAWITDAESFTMWRITALLALFGWTGIARIVRGQVLSLAQQDFVRAARALGAGPWRIMLGHILPNAASPIIVATTLAIGNLVLAESVLSFLGLGIQPPLASWGAMLTNAQELVTTAPMLAILPGTAIFVTVIAFNLVGDGLQDLLNPRGHARLR